MNEVLALQDLPENLQVFAKSLLDEGACISLLSVSSVKQVDALQVNQAMLSAGACISLLSVSKV